MIQRAAHRCIHAVAAGAAHPRWPPDRDAIRTAHRVWTATPAFGEPLAIGAHQSGLDREARAADTYARLMSRARHPAQTGPAHQTEFTQALPGAWERR
jgi:hypothetical protein